MKYNNLNRDIFTSVFLNLCIRFILLFTEGIVNISAKLQTSEMINEMLFKMLPINVSSVIVMIKSKRKNNSNKVKW